MKIQKWKMICCCWKKKKEKFNKWTGLFLYSTLCVIIINFIIKIMHLIRNNVYVHSDKMEENGRLGCSHFKIFTMEIRSFSLTGASVIFFLFLFFLSMKYVSRWHFYNLFFVFTTLNRKIPDKLFIHARL